MFYLILNFLSSKKVENNSGTVIKQYDYVLIFVQWTDDSPQEPKNAVLPSYVGRYYLGHLRGPLGHTCWCSGNNMVLGIILWVIRGRVNCMQSTCFNPVLPLAPKKN